MKTKTINIDLEAWDPSPLSSVTGGIRPDQMLVYSGGRQTGKSMLTMHMLKSRYYSTNLCKEVTLTAQQIVQEYTINWGIPVSKYKFSRKNWHWAEINTFADDYYERLEWCKQMFGAQPKNPDAWTRWYEGWGSLKFRDEADYIMYQLRWA